jgi:hypothetical protein
LQGKADNPENLQSRRTEKGNMAMTKFLEVGTVLEIGTKRHGEVHKRQNQHSYPM